MKNDHRKEPSAGWPKEQHQRWFEISVLPVFNEGGLADWSLLTSRASGRQMFGGAPPRQEAAFWVY